MLTHAWIIPLIPALSFVAILAIGKRLPRGGSEIGIAALAICFVLSLAVGVGWIQRVNHPPVVEGHATEAVVDGEHAAPAPSGTEEAGGEAHAAGEEEHHVTPPVLRP